MKWLLHRGSCLAGQGGKGMRAAIGGPGDQKSYSLPAEANFCYSLLVASAFESPEQLIRGFVFEFGSNDLKWWSSVLELLVEARDNAPVRYERYLFFMGRYLPENPASLTGFDVNRLDLTQKALLMFSLDVFADFMITRREDDLWLENWNRVESIMEEASRALATQPELLTKEKVDPAWDSLRAALS